MKKAKNIKIISVDLFRTIVDIEQTPETIWREFLKDKFPPELSKKYQQRADEIIWKRWDAAGIGNNDFKTVRMILEDVVTELFDEIHLDYNPKLAANSLVNVHNLETVFADAVPFLQKAGHNYTVCLASDADEEMIENVCKLYPFDKIFVSETMRLYKQNPLFFEHVIHHYNLRPECILHIGDSKSDIVTPSQLGVQTCWLNRRNRKWDHTVQPDFEVNTLLEIPDLLD
jgi:HAD superfamily hydrolase (TIGR01549 family)